MTTPTDAELWQLHMQMPGQHKDPIDFARAVLAKWGQPQAVAGGEPVACLVETGRGVMVWPIEDYEVACTYCDDDEFPVKLCAAPPPQAAREPLNLEQITAAAKKLAECMDYPWEYMPEQGRVEMRNHVVAVIEAVQGIQK